MRWFGEHWGAALCDDCERVIAPVGSVCIHCEEQIEQGDQGVIYDNSVITAAHLNCFLRQTIGSVAHVLGDCSCFVPGSTEGDPPGMTRRQAADEAVKTWQMMRDLKKVLKPPPSVQ